LKSRDSHVLRIGCWRVDPALDEISRDGTAVKLEPRTMRLLLCLAEHAGEVVSVEQLLDQVWKDVIVTPNSVYHAVAALRRVLGDSTKDPTYIANILRRGYRLVAPVAPWLDLPAVTHPESPAIPEKESLPPQTPATTAPGSRIRWFALALLIPLALVLSYMYVGRSTPHKAMLVVLPFQNLSGDAGQDYFSDGMTEELITQLGSLDPNRLGVIARTSSMHYKGSHEDVAEIARDLGVNYLLEGSVRGSRERVRVTAQLIATNDQTHLWAESFDRDSSDVLRLQGEVARAIADKIQLTLSEQTTARLTRTPSLDPQAHEAYLQGLQAENLRTRQGSEQAIAEFTRAIALEPKYADAYAGLARTYSLGTVVALGAPAEMWRRAGDAAVKALQLDDSVASAHTTMGFVHAHTDHDWPAAEREFHRGIELNPSDAWAHFFYSNSFLSPFGRHDEAIAEMKTAIRLDPISPPIDSFLGRTYLWARRYDDALAQLQKCIQRFPNFPINHVRLAHLYTYIGRFADAIAEETKARMLSGQDVREALNQEDALRAAYAARGERGYWEKTLEFAQASVNQTGAAAPEGYGTSYGMALLYARLGEKDRALESLERAFTERQLPMTEIGVEPALDPLRTDVRFQSLLRRVGLTR
jgi:TolB-like protein/DNA-binding winged helix-turn-helix (wHTH) protein/Tfp pilus assembly protein PilF